MQRLCDANCHQGALTTCRNIATIQHQTTSTITTNQTNTNMRTWSTISAYEMRPVSGAPSRAAAVQNPLMNAKSKKPDCSMRRAESASWQHGPFFSLLGVCMRCGVMVVGWHTGLSPLLPAAHTRACTRRRAETRANTRHQMVPYQRPVCILRRTLMISGPLSSCRSLSVRDDALATQVSPRFDLCDRTRVLPPIAWFMDTACIFDVCTRLV